MYAQCVIFVHVHSQANASMYRKNLQEQAKYIELS